MVETLFTEVQNYREIAQFIPGDVLYHICEATEDEGDRSVVSRKHHKNLNILSMMGVCRLWNDRICGLSGLFKDIAFDTSDCVTISTATRFLEIVETRSNDLHIYAQCRAWSNDDNRAVSKEFLSRLRLQSWRFIRFETGDMPIPFVAYFDLPAPRLLRLVHTSILPRELFASSFTNCRILEASVNKLFLWPTAILSNLVTLQLENAHPSHPFCSTSLFDLIQHARQLEELRLTDFLQFSGGSKAEIVHTNLKSAHFAQCNLKFILQRLRFPNATSLHVESYGISLVGELDLLASRGIGYFSPLQAYCTPILEQHRVTKVSIHIQDWLAENIYFKLGLECGTSRTICFRLAFQKEGHWEAYIQSSINEVLRSICLGAEVAFSIFHYPPLSPTNLPSLQQCQAPLMSLDSPLFLLPQVMILKTDYSLVRSTILLLADPEHRILPNLKCYSFDIETLPTSVDPVVTETTTCLRSRFNNGSPFAIQYWTLDGKTQYDVTLPTPADKRRFADTGVINITTVLIKESLPVLVPFLKGMGDGFVGEGGNIVSGDLYVEHTTLKL